MAFNSLSSIKTVHPWDTDQKWYMLQRNTDRLESRGEAKAGSIFQLDYNETKLRSSRSYGSNIVLENIEHERQKVFWQPELFISLDDDLKALLLAVDDPKERLHIYTEQKDLLYYAKGIKEGNLVELTLPGSGREAFGKVKYVGPSKDGDSARYFGIELSEPPQDRSVPKMDSDLFKCIQNRGVIVPMNCLKVHTKTVKPTLLEISGKHSLKPSKERKDGSGVGVEEAAKPPVISKGDVVMAYTKMQSGHGKCSWVMGTVLLIHEGKVAVEVDKSNGSVMQAWNGFHKHTKLMTSPSKDTVLVNLQCIKTLDQHTEVSSLAASEKGRKSYASVLQEGNPNPTPPSKGKISEQLAPNIRDTCSEMQENVQKANDMGTERSLQDFASSEESMSLSHGYLTSDERASSLQDSGNMNYPGKAVRRSSSVTEPKQNSSHTHKQVKHSGGKDSSSGNFMSSIKNAFSGKRGDAPKFPFKSIHFEILCKEKDVWADLLEELNLKKKWSTICNKEDDKLLRTEKMLKDWWESLHEGHNAELQKFTDCLRIHKLHDLADHIQLAPENAAFDVSVIDAVAHTANERWKILASNLPIEQHELNGKLMQSYSPRTNLHLVFDIWQQKEPGCHKIWKLIDACRKTGMEDVATDIEQGLSEKFCKSLARQIPKVYWRKLGGKLSISETRLDAFGLKFNDLAERVFGILCFWTMTSPLDTHKADVLAKALHSCSLGEVAAELWRDLGEEDLEITAALIDTEWKRLASHLSQYEVDHLMQSDQSSVAKALLVLKIWKRRQPLAQKKLKKSLYNFLVGKKFYRAARQLYDGLDDEMVVELANELCFEWTLLAKHFGYGVSEISRRFGSTDQLDMSYIMLKEWLNANKENDTKETKGKLFNGLKVIGRDDLVKWIEGRLSDTADEKTSTKCDTNLRQENTTPKSARFDRILMDRIEKAAPDMNENSFMDLLNMSYDSVRAHMPQSVRFENNPVVAVLSAWKKKMNQEGLGETDIINKLKDLFGLYGMNNVAAILPDLPPSSAEGSSVDMKSKREQSQGAVGGESTPEFNVYSMVEVDWDGKKRPGVIQWIGLITGLENHGEIAGIELEEGVTVGGTNGCFCSVKYFGCERGRGLFLPLSRCRPDSRFLTEMETNRKKTRTTEEDFGGVKCEPVEGHEKPPEKVMEESIGLFKGIQGDHNSCYMDVTLYSMFAFNGVFDAILNCDGSTKEEVRDVKDALRRTIVNPLRRHGFVRADYVLHFRELLNRLSSMEGLRTEEKDPEEFIHALLQELLNAKPFLAISQGTGNTMESYVYQIFLDKKEYLDIPTVQDLLHVSFLESDLKLTEVPECLIVQLPRYGKKYKLFDWIIPSLEMDIRLLIRDTPRPCSYCGLVAFVECRDCTPEPGDDDIIQSFCRECFDLKHETTNKKHRTNPLVVPKDFGRYYQHIANKYRSPEEVAEKTQHLYEEAWMELFSVVCIETSHYVAFVKAGSGDKAEWVFFDSMADRRGDQHGYNVPEVTHLRYFAAEMEREDLKDALKRSQDLSKYLKRLLSDAYICFYRPVKYKMGSPAGPKKPIQAPRDQDVSYRSPELKSNEYGHRNYAQQQTGDQNSTYTNITPRYPPAHHYGDSKPSVQYLEKNEIARQQKREKTVHQGGPVKGLESDHHQESALSRKHSGTAYSSQHNIVNERESWQQSRSNQSSYNPSPKSTRLVTPSELYQNTPHSIGCYDSQVGEEEYMEIDSDAGNTDDLKQIRHPPYDPSFQEGNTSEDSILDSFYMVEKPEDLYESAV